MRRQRYLFRQLVWLIAAVAFPLLALLAYNVHEDAQQVRKAAYEAVENYAAGIAHDAESLLVETENYLGYLAARRQIKALDPHHCDPVLEGVVQRRRHFANVLVTDLEGQPICSAIDGPGQLPGSFASLPWFQQARASDAMTLSKPFLAPVAQRQVSAMSLPLHDEAQRRIGVVTVLLDLESLQHAWARFVLPPDSRLTIFDDTGTILVTQPDFAQRVGRDIAGVIAHALEANPSGVGVAPGSDGVERAFAFKPVKVGGWQAAAAIPVEHVFAGYHALLQRSVAVGAAVVVGVLALALAMARRLAAPLRQIGNAARAVASGDLSVRAPDSLPGDFHHVAREFNAMLDAREAAHVREQRHIDFYKALSRTNSAIVRMADPQMLYEEICRICVEHGHASIAYISLLEGERVRPVAWAGPADGFLSRFAAPAEPGAEAGQGLTGDAVRTGQRQVANDCLDDPRTLPWRGVAEAIGTQALASFPFRREGQTVGALTLHMTVKGFFDERVIDLVDEMASDISFALDNLKREHERSMAEQIAEAHHQRFRMIFQTAPVSMSIVSMADQRLLAVNETFGAFTGQALPDLIGRNAFDAGLWPGEAERIAFVQQFREHRRVRNFEMHAQHASGESRDYLLQADTIEFDGQACVLTIANDVTDLRTAQRRLNEREKQLSGLVETAMDAIISIDAQHRVVLFNGSAAQMFLLPASEALGSTIDRFIPDRLHADHRVHVEEFERTGSTARRMGGLHTLVGLRSDGTEFPVEASISKLGQDDSVLMTVVIRDATETRRAEESRLAQATAEAASHAKTEFLSRMSHELRTPLNAVLGFSQLLQGDPTAPLSPSQHAQVEHIRQAGWHLLALINDVLDVSRIEAGRVHVEELGVNVAQLLDEALNLNEGAAALQGVSIIATYRSARRAFAWADPGRLRQVVINLLSNAIKYNRRGGRVEVNVSTEGE